MTVGKAPVRVAGIEVAAGTRGTASLPALELADGSVVDIPVIVLAGRHPGPRVYVGAAIHGDEVNGVHIVHRVVGEVDPGDLTGDLICVPIQNPLALQAQHRLAVQLLWKSPMDQFPGDPWMSFPGDPGGNSVQLVAGTLFRELISGADTIIDIHTPTTGGRYVPFAFLPPPATGEVHARSMRMAEHFAPDFILAADRGVYITPGGLHVVAAEHGIPAFGVELGEGGRAEEAVTQRGSAGVLNVLRGLGMLPGEVESDKPPRVIRSMTPVRCRRGGFLETRAALGEEVREGQLLATIIDRYGVTVEEVTAPHAGPFMRMTTFPTVASGERVGQVGVPQSSELPSDSFV